MNPGLNDPEFLDRPALDREVTRVFEKCHDCRRCLPLCPSFPRLFEAIDEHEQEAQELTQTETREVIDLCYQCKLCYNHCPYHPPHEWNLDFPKLMSRSKLVQAQEESQPLAERVGQRQDLIGRLSCLAAPVVNFAFRNRLVRRVMEGGSGIDRRWIMPRYERRPLSRSGAPLPRAENPHSRALFFPTCFVEYSGENTGRAALQVLAHNGVETELRYPGCCGAPFLHGGDLKNARRSARRLVDELAPQVGEDRPLVVPGPTCSLQIKREVPELAASEGARHIAKNTYDLGEYLWKLKGEDKLSQSFPQPLGRVAYHLPCHLKAQNIGFRSRQLLRLAGAEVEMLDHCSGVDGTWGMQARWYERSLKVAGKLANAIRRTEPERVASDCPLSALRILETTGRPAVHPVELLRDAYGLQPKP